MTKQDGTNIFPISNVRGQKKITPLNRNDTKSDPLWLLFVLEDIIEACKKNKLNESAITLEKASSVLEAEIFLPKVEE